MVNRQVAGNSPVRNTRDQSVRKREAGMQDVDDRRVRRTRAALREALMVLMTQKGYDAVTVQEVIDRADVGRSTFYAHYTDKTDLLDDMLAQLRGRLLPPVSTEASDRRRPLRFSLEMFRHVSDQRLLLLGLLGPSGGSPVVAHIERMLTEVVAGELGQLAAPEAPPRVPLDLVAASLVASFLATLRWWVDTEFAKTPEQMDALYQAMVAPGIRIIFKAPTPGASPDQSLSVTARQ
jgi:AcrR family transcriptional regulator